MSDAAVDSIETPAKRGKKSLILAVLLALIGAAGGFYLVYSGLFPTGAHISGAADHGGGHQPDHGASASLEDIAFVEMDPLLISLSDGKNSQHLRFRAQLEVAADYQNEVEKLLPRVTDVLNSYLRALQLSDIRDPMALMRLRGQMLRRVQVVVGQDRVHDLLVMEFVLK